MRLGTEGETSPAPEARLCLWPQVGPEVRELGSCGGFAEGYKQAPHSCWPMEVCAAGGSGTGRACAGTAPGLAGRRSENGQVQVKRQFDSENPFAAFNGRWFPEGF